MSSSFFDKVALRRPGIAVYGLAPPKDTTSPEQLAAIVAQQMQRFASMSLDGLIVYDIQDEAERTAEPRPFPFLPTKDPESYARDDLVAVEVPKIVYRSVARDTPESFGRWLSEARRSDPRQASVLVGAPRSGMDVGLKLNDAYALARENAEDLFLGGIAIAERHAKYFREHERILAKTEQGCRFFVTQAVYDVTSTKSLLSDYALAVRERGLPPAPILVTFSPCGSEKTLGFMKWLGISFPRWLENELRFAADPLSTSLRLCERIFEEIWEYATEKGIPLGVNVESVSIRKAEIEASVELFRSLQGCMRASIGRSS